MSGYASNPNSWFFIPRVKGECEEALKNLNFPKLTIYRPGLLRCSRNESRPLEFAARCLSNTFDKFDFWSISTLDLATAIVKTEQNQPILVLEHWQITRICKQIHPKQKCVWKMKMHLQQKCVLFQNVFIAKFILDCTIQVGKIHENSWDFLEEFL